MFFHDGQGKETSLAIKDGVVSVDDSDVNTLRKLKDEGFTQVGESKKAKAKDEKDGE